MMETELISLVKSDKASIPWDLLLMADPSREMIKRYLGTSDLYLTYQEDELVGVLVMQKISEDKIEIKNLAVKEGFQGQGIGRWLIRQAKDLASSAGYHQLQICTGSSSFGQLYLYLSEGFEVKEMVKNYFTDNYAEPIKENGILCKHLIRLVKKLG